MNTNGPALERFHRRAVLTVSTLAFTLLFAVWVLFSIIGLPIRKELGLSEGQFALLTAVPILTGSLLRLPLGICADRFGGRRVFALLCLITAVPTFLLSLAQSYEQLLVLAFFIGLAGASFAVGVSWNSAWFEAQSQGLALGVFGAGNVGASITKLLAPALLTLVPAAGLGGIPGGWRFVPWVYGIALVVTALMVWSFTPRDRVLGEGRSLAELLRPLRQLRVWRFGLYYVVVFGAYVGLSLWLPKYYVDVYGTSLALAGLLTALFIFPASLLRPLGGYLSDRMGARRLMYLVFGVILAASLLLLLPPKLLGVWGFTVLVVVIGFAMGVGKAANFKMVAVWYPRDIGATGGMVGMLGGLGGFFLPPAFAWIEGLTGLPQSIFLVTAGLAFVCLVWLHIAVLGIRISQLEAQLKTLSNSETAR
ncbi:MFS transporter [Thermus scotoductus]|jgi:NNP family nitrate/nitrite transporter-like MFS transporter|uniref:Nitrate transporter permease n=3 Tax=Thermus scotoductus TaxID=37636 RepID=A0A430RAD3_THESC|nr:MFS transporter [Thermus scotoductus]RTH04345.1 nitrate transporter permease [Thermus scotoductus]